MDPEVALAQAREALHSLRDAASSEAKAEAGEELAEAFEALDGWMTKGGFPPKDWRRA